MNNQPWDKARLEEWKKFWESEMGQEAIAKMQNLRERCLAQSMVEANPDSVVFYVGRAGGIDLVLEDIQAGFNALEELKNKDGGKEAKVKSK